MIDLQAIVAEYFLKARSSLDTDYVWKIPETVPIPFVRGTDSHARANMRLRRELRNAWQNEPSRRYELAIWYVSYWGGIRSNKNETIQAYCDSSEEYLAASTWKGVATWSKILAMRNPDKYPIYDARVGAALLALQLLKGTTNPILFCQTPTQNKAVEKFQRRINQTAVTKGQTYKDYVALLVAVEKRSGLTSPEEIEMVLFANSVSLVANCQRLLS